MYRYFARHWTFTVAAIAVLAWVAGYFPRTPQFALLQLKHAIDNRDGRAAARFVDFESVVKHAGEELAGQKENTHDRIFNELLGRGAVAMLSKPLAQFAQSYMEQKVNEGAKEVQFPPAAVIGAMFLMRRNGDTATTTFKDPKGKTWQIVMHRAPDGQWQVAEVKNIQQWIEGLQSKQGGNPVWQ